MPTHAETRTLPYTPEQLFDLVADVESYPAFLPWCSGCKITRRIDGGENGPRIIYADLSIGYKMIRETFGSRVTLERPDHIHVEYLRGPMKNLSNHWRFIPTADGHCRIDFYVEFEFRNPFLQGVIELFFNEAVRRMVGAFESRAKELYG
jgi:coenzyme Q-binding protein COQ10